MNGQVKFKLARRRAAAKLGFYAHLCIFGVCIAVLALLNWQSGFEKPWVMWPAFGWAMGLLCHGITVFSWSSRSKLLDRMAQKELKRIH